MDKKIIELEKAYWKAMETKDFETIKRLTRFPCITVGKEGINSIDEPTFKQRFDSAGNMKLTVKDISHIESQMIHDTSAVIAYQITLAYDMEGKTQTNSCACSSTWSKENDQWKCVLHTESEIA